MNRENLIHTLKQLKNGPHPTREKKLYGISTVAILNELPKGLVMELSILGYFKEEDIPTQEEAWPSLIIDRLEEQLKNWKNHTSSGVAFIRDTHLLPKYQIPLTNLYKYVGDSHAILLWIETQPKISDLIPLYIEYNYQRYFDYFQKSLNDQLCIEVEKGG